jgi:hypothetical protein
MWILPVHTYANPFGDPFLHQIAYTTECSKNKRDQSWQNLRLETN